MQNKNVAQVSIAKHTRKKPRLRERTGLVTFYIWSGKEAALFFQSRAHKAPRRPQPTSEFLKLDSGPFQPKIEAFSDFLTVTNLVFFSFESMNNEIRLTDTSISK